MEIVTTLVIWYLVYVLFDVLSTYWLVRNTSVGIGGEANPIGVVLYSGFGLGGILLAKLVGFTSVSVGAVVVDTKYGGVGWVRESVETLLLGLVGLSSLAALQNFGWVVVVQVLKGQAAALAGEIAAVAVFLAFAVVYATARVVGVWGRARILEATLGTLVMVGPLLVWNRAFSFAFEKEPPLFVAYLLIMYLLVSGAVYLIDEVRRGRLPRSPDASPS